MTSLPPEVAEVLEGKRRWAVTGGDSLAVLRTLPSKSVDAVVTDPPYSSGGAFRGDRAMSTNAKYVQSEDQGTTPDFLGDNRDQRGFSYWCALWLSECLRIAKPGAVLASFCDWRQLPALTDSIQAGGWMWRGIVPWDKTEGARPVMGRPRAQCEYLLFASAGPLAPRKDVGVLPGLIRCAVDVADKHHIAGKPAAVMQAVARWCVPSGIILDPFCGSATTGVGAIREGRRFVGIELDDHWRALAEERLRAESDGHRLSEARAGQSPMFPGGTP